MTEKNYTIRCLRRDELDFPIGLAAAEGWNPGKHDADSFYAADPDGFLVGELDGEPISTISAVRYGKNFGFLGLYIVKPEQRGHGYGLKIWQEACRFLGGRIVGLDGVPAQQDNYRKSGFTLEYRHIRFQGIGDAGSSALDDTCIAPVSEFPFAELAAYDRPLFGAVRESFLRSWITRPGTVSLGIRGKDGKLNGFGVLRPCRNGYKIGPLFAETPASAERLFRALVRHVPAGESFFLDVPEKNPAARKMAEARNMRPMFETARMYASGNLNLTTARIFGTTTLELG